MHSGKLYTASDNSTAKEHVTHQPLQSNHESCFIPAGIRQHTGKPLYILVAFWCLQQEGWVQRNQISEAFHITARRASYLMSYLREKTRLVNCKTRRHTLSNNVYRYEIRVTAVAGDQEQQPLSRQKREKTGKNRHVHSRVGNADTTCANELWNRINRSRCEETNREGKEKS
ncbi:CaiF/GrlA family transcriptional regulator [Salmonella enterica subsp. enterica serovar Eastbourne]|nr:CaiF/GrlA family transcriptional regulator [Salmonella enterica subsp. diarizonae]ECG2271371.1 CaiF/GrlA family transcriptional regulator [Salmonella enterica subsp. enterica serovar Eastbourne]